MHIESGMQSRLVKIQLRERERENKSSERVYNTPSLALPIKVTG